MATISNTPRPGYVWDSTDNVWYPIGTGPHTHADYITSGSAINPTIVDAKGDIIAATAADTVARLAVGANDTVLTADSSTATGLKWAAPSSGGMTLLSTTSLTGSSVTVSSISTAYNDLYVEIRNMRTSQDDRTVNMRFNNDTGSNYTYSNIWSNVGSLTNNSGTTTSAFVGKSNSSSSSSTFGFCSIRIPLYASTSYRKCYSVTFGSTNPSGLQGGFGAGRFDTASAITEITLLPDAGNFDAGTMLIYGVK